MSDSASFPTPEASKAWAKMIAKAWLDPKFKARLIANPRAVFKEHGVEIPNHIEPRIIEGYRHDYPLWLPPKPEGVAESDLTGHASNVADITRSDITRADITRQCADITRAALNADITRQCADITHRMCADITHRLCADITHRLCADITRDCQASLPQGGDEGKESGD